MSKNPERPKRHRINLARFHYEVARHTQGAIAANIPPARGQSRRPYALQRKISHINKVRRHDQSTRPTLRRQRPRGGHTRSIRLRENKGLLPWQNRRPKCLAQSHIRSGQPDIIRRVNHPAASHLQTPRHSDVNRTRKPHVPAQRQSIKTTRRLTG